MDKEPLEKSFPDTYDDSVSENRQANYSSPIEYEQGDYGLEPPTGQGNATRPNQQDDKRYEPSTRQDNATIPDQQGSYGMDPQARQGHATTPNWQGYYGVEPPTREVYATRPNRQGYYGMESPTRPGYDTRPMELRPAGQQRPYPVGVPSSAMYPERNQNTIVHQPRPGMSILPPQEYVEVPDYFFLSCISIFFCVLIGFASLINSIKARDLVDQKQYQTALNKAQTSLVLGIVAIILGIVIIVLNFAIVKPLA